MKNTEKAFLWIINLLEEIEIQYKISGGFAARVHGVDRELADIDIEVADENISIIAEKVQRYITFGPARYKDENWDLELMTLLYEGQDIDISGIGAKIFNKESGNWESLSADLQNSELMEVYGKRVRMDTIENLITYKSKLRRDVDIEDVRQLKLIRIQ